MRRAADHLPRLGIVGPCTAGKSTLIRNINGRYPVELRHIAQEHSYVPYMWQRINPPNWLVFLDVSYDVSLERKKLNWTEAEYQEQQRRLAHARQHADLYLDTDDLTPEQVAGRVEDFLNRLGFVPSE
jgi:ATPase subunit of ABC transporter with duplicated ATPase domains